jgi:hypothetical protein
VASATLLIALLLHPLIPLGAMAIALFLQRPKLILIFITISLIVLVLSYVFAIPPITQLGLTIDKVWRGLA